MGRKTITLKGAAAKAFLGIKKEVPPKTEDEQYERIATLVHMHIASDDMKTAVQILKDFHRLGLLPMTGPVRPDNAATEEGRG